MAAGSGAVPSHQTLAALYEAEGAEEKDEIEITVPDDRDIDLAGVTVYRSRRGTKTVRTIDGIKVPEVRLWQGLVLHGGRGVKGTWLLRSVLAHRPKGRPAKSRARRRQRRVAQHRYGRAARQGEAGRV